MFKIFKQILCGLRGHIKHPIVKLTIGRGPSGYVCKFYEPTGRYYDCPNCGKEFAAQHYDEHSHFHGL